MRVEQLQYLLAIKNSHSISQAAEILHISQQAISIAIKQLEDELGTTMLERTSKGSYLTSEGEEVIAFASEFFNKWDILVHKFRTINKHEKNTVALYIQPSMKIDTFLNEIISALYNNIPQLELTINYDSSENIVRYIQNHSSAIGLINVREENLKKIPNCHQIIFNVLYLTLWGSNKSKILKQKPCSLASLRNVNFFSFNINDPNENMLISVIEKYQLNRYNHITYGIPNYVSKQLVEDNIGIFIEFMSEKIIQENKSNIGVRVIPKENLKAYQIGITRSLYLYNILTSVFTR